MNHRPTRKAVGAALAAMVAGVCLGMGVAQADGARSPVFPPGKGIPIPGLPPTGHETAPAVAGPAESFPLPSFDAPPAGGLVSMKGTSSPAGAAEHPKVRIADGTLFVTGTEGDDQISLELAKPSSAILVVDLNDGATGPLAITNKRPVPRALFTRIHVETRSGNDSIRVEEANGIFTDTEQTTMDGGPGEDTMTGGSGREVYLGGSELDRIDGNRGDDAALMGAGDDIFAWDPGDGNDTIEGQDGFDTMQFNGNTAPEKIELSANGPRLRLVRDVGNITMDSDDVEHVLVRPSTGSDTVTVNDLSGTDVTFVEPNLAAAVGGVSSDIQPDVVRVRGTNGDDVVEIAGVPNNVTVVGLQALVKVRHADANAAVTDDLVVETFGGRESIAATTLPAGAIDLTIDSGSADDAIRGSQGNDVILGQEDADFLFGDDGDDVLVGGNGDDLLDGGAGDDVLVGGPGADEMTCGEGDDTAIPEGPDTIAADC